MNIAQLKALDALASRKSVSKAAQMLNVSQPAVSMHLRNLQAQYGVKLFWVKGKHVEFSELGREVVQKTRKILGLMEDLASTLQAASDLRSGRLRIGLSCHYFVMGIVAAFMERYPGVQVKASVDQSLHLLESVHACRLDVAEVTGTEPDPGLFNFHYSHQTIVVFTRAEHPWSRAASLDIAQLHDQPMVAWHVNSMTRRIFLDRLSRAGVAPRIVLEVDSWETMREAVAAGLGFGAVLEDEFSPDRRLSKFAFKGADLSASQYFVCLPEFRELRAVDALFRLVAEMAPLRAN